MADGLKNNLNLTAADLFPASKQADVDSPTPVTDDRRQRHAGGDPNPTAARPRPVPPGPMSGTANVLHVRVVTGSGGGPEKTILRSPGYSDPSHYRVSAAYLHPGGDPGMCAIRQAARDLGCDLYEIAERYALDHQSIGALIELCREMKVDIWHGHDYKSNLLGLIVKRFHKMKLVTTAHGFTRETWRTRLYYHVDNLAMLGYDHVIAVSPKLVEHCARHGVNPSRLTYIPNAIDTQEYRRTQSIAEAKAGLDLPSDRYAVGVFGRLSPEKGVDRAVRMMGRLLATQPRTELHLIGGGPQERALRRLTEELGIAHAVRWWGWQPDTRPIYEAMDLLVLPSRTEGLPNVVLEAMAMGVPVAATDVGGVRDLLNDGDCGVILGEDERGWAAAIEPLITRSTLRNTYAERAYRRVRESFGFSQRMGRVMSVYDRVLGRGGAGQPTAERCKHANRRAA